MKKAVTLLLAATVAICHLSAQQTVTFIEIDPQEIERTLEVEVGKALTGNAEWGVSRLVTRVTEQLPEGINGIFERQKPNKKAITPEETYARCSEAILMFCNYYDCGQCDRMHVGIGASATVLTPDGICLTNYHVLEDIITNNTEMLRGDSLYFVGSRDGRCYPITHVLAYDKDSDAAIFRIDTRGDRLAHIPLGEPALTGSKVRAVTHPQGLPYYYSEGVVARNMKMSRDGKELKRMQISADYAVGSSGSAILDECGNLVGMVGSTQTVFANPEQRAGVQIILKNTIPVSEIKKLLDCKFTASNIRVLKKLGRQIGPNISRGRSGQTPLQEARIMARG